MKIKIETKCDYILLELIFDGQSRFIAIDSATSRGIVGSLILADSALEVGCEFKRIVQLDDVRFSWRMPEDEAG